MYAILGSIWTKCTCCCGPVTCLASVIGRHADWYKAKVDAWLVASLLQIPYILVQSVIFTVLVYSMVRLRLG